MTFYLIALFDILNPIDPLAITSDTTSANQPPRNSPPQLKYSFLPPLSDTNR